MRRLARDMRHAARRMWNSPGFTVAAVATLALGIGANATVFNVAHALLLDELPVEEPDRLFWVQRSLGENEMSMRNGVRVDFSEWHSLLLQEELAQSRDGSPISGAAALDDIESVMLHGATTAAVDVQAVSGVFFELLGVGAALGRTLTPDDDREDAPTVVVLHHAFWQERLASDPNVVGDYIRLRGQPALVVGVAPPGFSGMSDLWIPDMWTAVAAVDRLDPPLFGAALRSATNHRVRLIVRAAPDANVETARTFVELAVNRVRSGGSAADSKPPAGGPGSGRARRYVHPRALAHAGDAVSRCVRVDSTDRLRERRQSAPGEGD